MKIISWNVNWIMDSEYMNYVCDNDPSPRIKEFIKDMPLKDKFIGSYVLSDLSSRKFKQIAM